MRIDPYWFIVFFCIGMFFVYISTPTPELIIKYPTPDQVDDLLYKDLAGSCYRYKTEEVTCPSNPKEFKLQSGTVQPLTAGPKWMGL
jgi:hypothetical protein